jgi:alpha-L-fucosidase 2
MHTRQEIRRPGLARRFYGKRRGASGRVLAGILGFVAWVAVGCSGSGESGSTCTAGSCTGGTGASHVAGGANSSGAPPGGSSSGGTNDGNGGNGGMNGNNRGGSLSAGGSAGNGGGLPGAGGVAVGGSIPGGAGGADAGSGGTRRLEIEQGSMTLWYDEPAGSWTEALPIGNGRLAAMVFGGPASERLQLNESSFWSGGPSRNDNPNARSALAQVRQLIFDGQYTDAEALINQSMTASELHGSMFQPIGDLTLSFSGHDAYSNYRRELDLARALATTKYDVGGVTYTREVFASQPDQLIVVRLGASQPGRLSFSLGMGGPRQSAVNVLDPNTLESTGTSSTHEGVSGQVEFSARVRLATAGGTTAASSTGINVSNADEVLMLVSIATNFVDYLSVNADEKQRSADYLSAAQGKTYEALLGSHLTAYQNYFDRVALDLGNASSALPTDQRIAAFAENADPELAAMYFQFGRYLLISSSQPGGQPANLQGIWNDQASPPWDSKYTININTEMNYWPAEKCNLSELHEPLFRMIEELSESGAQTAETMYGADGWMAHHNTDIWRISGVVDGAFWGMWPMGGAWLSQHLWERYLYTGDRQFLESVYPILKSACEFYQDFLIEEPDNQWLVVSPSISPENAPANRGTSVCAGATMDNQILFDLFSKTIRAASILGRDAALIAEFQAILERLPPMQIGRFGQLQEWLEDLDNPDDQHRHVSHLYGLFPSNQISPSSSPELFGAARTTLEHRGDVSTGWSMGWKVNFWARLLDGDHALKLIRDQLTPQSGESGGTYPNFFDAHPPFQIDGNFGCTSGMTEMLLQSHDGAIHLLPALPAAWKAAGGVAGLRAYGGFELDFTWQDGAVNELVIRSSLGGNCRLRVPNELISSDGSALPPASGDNPNSFFQTPVVKDPIISASADVSEPVLPPTFVYDLATEAGKAYSLAVKP